MIDKEKKRKKYFKGTIGPPIKENKLKPFKKRISPELLAKMAENTKINNKKIKFFTLIETKDEILARNIVKEVIKIKKGG